MYANVKRFTFFKLKIKSDMHFICGCQENQIIYFFDKLFSTLPVILINLHKNFHSTLFYVIKKTIIFLKAIIKIILISRISI